MILPRLCIQRPVLTIMMNVALILFGVISLQRLPVRELPDIDPPIVSVTTIYPGANAAVVETEVTEKLEEDLNNIEGIKTITSDSAEQVSNITIEFNLSRDIDLAAQDVRDRVARVRGSLPDDIKDPIVAKQDADANAVMWIGLDSERYTPLELTTLAERQIKPRLQTVRGVSSVMLGGEQRFAMRLWLDAEKMAAHQVTVLDVARALREQSVELPSGRVENLHREMTIEMQGQLKTVEEFNRMIIRSEGNRVVRLRDIGEAKSGVANERTVARNNGRPCVFLGIVKQSKANTVEVAAGVRAEMALIEPTLPPGIAVVFNFDESLFVRKAIDEVWVSLGIAFVLVVLVIYFFLGDARSTLVPGVAIPVSIIGTFAVLHAFGYSVNILTMLALVLAIGVVVDDAIVVVENIYRHIEQGLSPREAAVKAMDEIAFAVIAITLSLVAVFLPLAFQSSATGRLFIEFAVAVCASVVISAFVALTLSPMLASRVLKPFRGHERHVLLVRWFDRLLVPLTRGYARLLAWSLRHRITVVAVAFASVFLTLGAFSRLEREFLPEEDKNFVLCMIFGPEGSTSEYTDRMVKQVEDILRKTPEVDLFGAIVAPGFNGPGQATFGIAFVRLKERDQRTRDVRALVNGPGGLRMQMFNGVEGAIALPQIPKAIGRGFSAPFQLVLKTHDLQALDAYANTVVDRLRAYTNLVNVRSTFEVTKPELRLGIDRDRATALGVSIADISRTLQVLFGGLDLSRIKMDGKEYDVITQLARGSRLTPQDLDRLYVRNAHGRLIQLNSLVTRDTGAAPNAIEHYNRMRSATISGSLNGIPLGTAMADVEKLVRADLPPGFLMEWAGESRDLNDAGSEVQFVLILALLIVYMVLAAQFESFIHPFTVILAVPLAGLGAFGLLWLLHALSKAGVLPALPAMNLNLFSMIGLVLLVGLVTKNSILLVEFANQRRLAGQSAFEAMLEAGRVRLRPILMTALSTIAGILPIAIGFGAGGESRRPLGVAVVGGMITSTLLTLVVIPVAYTVFDDLAARFRRRSQEVPSGSLEPVSGK